MSNLTVLPVNTTVNLLANINKKKNNMGAFVCVRLEGCRHQLVVQFLTSAAVMLFCLLAEDGAISSATSKVNSGAHKEQF